jgi:TetR/AcrR family transcriptional regulator of autoinduction and epiphytic fitness
MNDFAAIPEDGRVARGFRTQIAVADALLDLLKEGVERPTALQIAKRANISLRLVFHHFEDLESVYATAAERQLQRVSEMFTPIDAALPFEKRVTLFARQRAKVYEFISPARRAVTRMESGSEELSNRMRAAHQMSRELALSVFERELGAMSPAKKAETSIALDAIVSWEMWEFLRRRAELSEKHAMRSMEQMVRNLLVRE